MRPIAPPPRRPRSRQPRSREDRVLEPRDVRNSVPVDHWLPFGNELKPASSSESVDVFMNKFDEEVAISASFSGEESNDETGNIEVQLGSSVGYGGWGSGGLGTGLKGVTPIPVPAAVSRRGRSSHAEDESVKSSTSSKRSSVAGNRKYIQRKGLIKRNEDQFANEEMKNSNDLRRGRSTSTTRSRKRESSRVRSSSIMTKAFAKNRKAKANNARRKRSKSIVRVGPKQNRPVLSEINENDHVLEERRDWNQKESSVQIDSSIDETPFDEIPNVDQLSITTPVADVAADHSNISLPRPIHTRQLLETSVYHNEATGIWITTINMSQKETVNKSNAAKYLKAFSFQTESEARESAYANAPAKMIPYDENHFCFSCSTQFSVFKRAAHCRNCGVCVCSNCTTNWSKVCIPETYNIKGESTIKVCKACDSLSKLFQRSLLEARYEDAIAVYNTGNINLRCPFMTSKGGEAMLPIHCAAEGGSLEILHWLVDVHFCPLKRIRTSNRNKSQHTDELITTSKGKSVLEIAMSKQNVDILRYLVNDKDIDVKGIRDLNIALAALQTVLRTPYNGHNDDSQSQITPVHRALSETPETKRPTRINNGLPSFTISGIDDSDSASDRSAKDIIVAPNDSDDDQSVATTVHDACIICYENTIDCVITPCGHQICCLQCSKNMETCPVCNINCKFIRTFRP